MAQEFIKIEEYIKVFATPNNLYVLYQSDEESLRLARYHSGTKTWSRVERFGFQLGRIKLQHSSLLWDNETLVLLCDEVLILYDLKEKQLINIAHLAAMTGFAPPNSWVFQPKATVKVTNTAGSAATIYSVKTSFSPYMRVNWTSMAVDAPSKRIFAQCWLAWDENPCSLALYSLHWPTQNWNEIGALLKSANIGENPVSMLESKTMAIWKGKMYLLLEKQLQPGRLYSCLQMVSRALLNYNFITETFALIYYQQVIDLESLTISQIAIRPESILRPLNRYQSVCWTQPPGSGRLVGAFYDEICGSPFGLNELWSIHLGEEELAEHPGTPETLYRQPGSSEFGFRPTYAKSDTPRRAILTAKTVCLSNGKLGVQFTSALIGSSSKDIWLLPTRNRGSPYFPSEDSFEMAVSEDVDTVNTERMVFYRIPVGVPTLHELARGAFVSFPPRAAVQFLGHDRTFERKRNVDFLKHFFNTRQVLIDIRNFRFNIQCFRFSDSP